MCAPPPSSCADDDFNQDTEAETGSDPKLTSGPKLLFTCKERDIISHRGHRVGGFIICRLRRLLVYRLRRFSITPPPPPRLVNRVTGSVEENDMISGFPKSGDALGAHLQSRSWWS